ncbi:MAG: methionine ABC transporter permease [Spirochaetota bacterium]|jgi:D-methionine transport system permease protein
MNEALSLLAKPLGETLLMIAASTLIAGILGGLVGILLFALSNDRFAGKHRGARFAKRLADRAINMLRSFPYIILMVLVLPLSRLIVGTSLGTLAAIVPLSVAAIPFLARIVESALSEVDSGVIDAAISCAASKTRILFAILIPEALPSLVSGLTLTMISLLGYSAMAGVIGGGGLGDLAIRYGYQRFRGDVMAVAVVTIIILVELIQFSGTTIARSIRAKR